jgi:hypothetical protein
LSKRHVTEQYYSIQITTPKTQKLYIAGFDGTAAELAKLINKITAKSWEKVRVYKYVQTLDMQKDEGSRIVSKKRSLLKIDRVGCGSLCTKVDADFTKNGEIPANIRAFFGENQK